MTVKQFFKSTSFKCIISLLCILLVCGIFLTVAYGFLEVTAGEKLQRAIKKIYPGQTVTIYGLDENGNEIVIDSSVTNPNSFVSETIEKGNAEIKQAYKITFSDSNELNYLVQSLGKGGYSGGSVTCWVAIGVKDECVTGINKVTVAESSGQSFIGKITDAFLERFSSDYTENVYYEPNKDDGFVSSGATLSSTAICNSVNGALEYVKTEILGEDISYPYDGFDYTDKIDITNPSSDYTVSDGKVTYTIVTSSNPPASSFTIEIVVDSDKKIESFKVIKYGSVDSQGRDKTAEEYNAIIDKNLPEYVGKDETYFKAIIGENGLTDSKDTYDENLTTGATRSNYLCLYAGLFATANYDTAISQWNGGEANE